MTETLMERESGEGGDAQAQRWGVTGWSQVAEAPEADTDSGLISGRTESSSRLSRSMSAFGRVLGSGDGVNVGADPEPGFANTVAHAAPSPVPSAPVQASSPPKPGRSTTEKEH